MAGGRKKPMKQLEACFFIIHFISINKLSPTGKFLNQAHAWFLRISSVLKCLYACMFVCPPPRLLITSGMMWRDMDSI